MTGVLVDIFVVRYHSASIGLSVSTSACIATASWALRLSPPLSEAALSSRYIDDAMNA